jgi:predicted molibdopterin-dependent oxidoreductase YjgC
MLVFHTSHTLPTRSGPGLRVSFPGFQPEGVASVPFHVTDKVPVGTVFSTFHSSEIYVLTNDSLDAVCKVPELKMCAVTIEKVD